MITVKFNDESLLLDDGATVSCMLGKKTSRRSTSPWRSTDRWCRRPNMTPLRSTTATRCSSSRLSTEGRPMAFKLIAITPELTLPDETWRITHLLDAGFDAVHLRKPHCGEEEMRGYVDTLPAGIADRLAMHYFPDVAAEKGIGGVHLNKRSPRVPEGWEGRREPLLPLAGGGG